MTIDQYRIVKKLGEGLTAKVFQVRDDESGEEFAMKVFDLDNPKFDEKAFRNLQAELDTAYDLEHQHIVRYYSLKEEATMIKEGKESKRVAYIVQELVTGGELFDFLANFPGMSAPVTRYYFKQLMQGVSHIHWNGFAHRDLKPENILLDANFDIKIADFGFATPLYGRKGDSFNTSTVGTVGYMAPEMFLNRPYQAKMADFFSLGVILFILYAGHPPFENATKRDGHYKYFIANKVHLFWKSHEKKKPNGFYSESFKELMTLMLQPDPNNRLCLADIIGHEWLKEGLTATREQAYTEMFRRHAIASVEPKSKSAEVLTTSQGSAKVRRGSPDIDVDVNSNSCLTIPLKTVDANRLKNCCFLP